MNTVVFFTELSKLHDALHMFPITDFADKQVPVKLHMGEIKNKYFLKPSLAHSVVRELLNVGANPFLFDTTVAYSGLRHSKLGYHKVAQIHGFTPGNIGCPVVIGDRGVSVAVDNRDYEVADELSDAAYIFALSHVKGHVATGMGGAIKNFGMGGVTKETKQRMHHGSRPLHWKDACTLCGVCAEVCPFSALKINGQSWKRNERKCFGCGVCVDQCTSGGLTYVDADLQYVLACAALACLRDKHVLYLNDLHRIARSCDCDPFAGPLICPDIGFLVSDDPVAIDKASLDLIHEVKPDVFRNEHKIDPYKQIRFGEELGLGVAPYALHEI